MDNVYCRGTEKSIGQCRHRGWHRSNCDHYEDVGVKCHVPQLQGHKVRMLQPKVVRTGCLIYDLILNPISQSSIDFSREVIFLKRQAS